MIVYEVRALVQREVSDDYRAWLDAHVHEILGIAGFTHAELHAEEDVDGRAIWIVRYHLQSREALEIYLREHAPRLRAEGLARFGDRVSATRRVTELVRRFD